MNRARTPILIAVFVSIASAAPAIEVQLTYERLTDRSDRFPYGFARLEKTFELPPGDWKLPELQSAIPIYSLMDLGDHKCLLIVDQRRPDDPFYNRIYLDVNGNRDLTDDPPIDGVPRETGQGSYSPTRFPMVDTTIVMDGEPVPYRLDPGVRFPMSGTGRLTRATLEQRLQIEVWAHCRYRGELTLGDRRYEVVLGDGNANGRFGDWRSGEEPDLRDPLYLLPSVEEGDIIEPTFWGDRLLLDGILYRVSVNTPDRKLTLTILDEEMAQLVVPRELQYLSLLAEEGQLVTFAETDGMVEVPVGSYQLVQFTMVRVDAQGRRWHGHGGGDSRTPRIAATKDGPSELKFGGPYVPEVRVTDSSRNRWERGAASVWLQPYLRGQGGELLLTLSYEFPESGRAERPSEPSYAIYRPDGTIAAQGKFEYG